MSDRRYIHIVLPKENECCGAESAGSARLFPGRYLQDKSLNKLQKTEISEERAVLRYKLPIVLRHKGNMGKGRGGKIFYLVGCLGLSKNSKEGCYVFAASNDVT